MGRCKQKQCGLRGYYVAGSPLLNERCTFLLRAGRRAPVSEMTYTVSSGTLNSTIPIPAGDDLDGLVMFGEWEMNAFPRTVRICDGQLETRTTCQPITDTVQGCVQVRFDFPFFRIAEDRVHWKRAAHGGIQRAERDRNMLQEEKRQRRKDENKTTSAESTFICENRDCRSTIGLSTM